MSSLNKVQLIGRLGQDPEIRTINNETKVANLSIATSDKYKDANGEWQEKTEWHRVVVWGKKAEVVEKYIKKGSLIYVEGPMETNKWQDKNGVDRYTTQVKALNITFLDSKGSDNSNSTEKPDSSNSNNNINKPSPSVDIDNLNMDDDLPF